MIVTLLGFSSAAQAQSVALSGRVISAGTEIVVQTDQGPSTAMSDVTGRFEISRLESGEYRISARALGFSPVTQRQIKPFSRA